MAPMDLLFIAVILLAVIFSFSGIIVMMCRSIYRATRLKVFAILNLVAAATTILGQLVLPQTALWIFALSFAVCALLGALGAWTEARQSA